MLILENIGAFVLASVGLKRAYNVDKSTLLRLLLAAQPAMHCRRPWSKWHVRM